MAGIPDGRVWCEACNTWLPSTATWLKHKWICPKKVLHVENRPDGAWKVKVPA